MGKVHGVPLNWQIDDNYGHNILFFLARFANGTGVSPLQILSTINIPKKYLFSSDLQEKLLAYSHLYLTANEQYGDSLSNSSYLLVRHSYNKMPNNMQKLIAIANKNPFKDLKQLIKYFEIGNHNTKLYGSELAHKKLFNDLLFFTLQSHKSQHPLRSSAIDLVKKIYQIDIDINIKDSTTFNLDSKEWHMNADYNDLLKFITLFQINQDCNVTYLLEYLGMYPDIEFDNEIELFRAKTFRHFLDYIITNPDSKYSDMLAILGYSFFRLNICISKNNASIIKTPEQSINFNLCPETISRLYALCTCNSSDKFINLIKYSKISEDNLIDDPCMEIYLDVFIALFNFYTIESAKQDYDQKALKLTRDLCWKIFHLDIKANFLNSDLPDGMEYPEVNFATLVNNLNKLSSIAAENQIAHINDLSDHFFSEMLKIQHNPSSKKTISDNHIYYLVKNYFEHNRDAKELESLKRFLQNKLIDNFAITPNAATSNNTIYALSKLSLKQLVSAIEIYLIESHDQGADFHLEYFVSYNQLPQLNVNADVENIPSSEEIEAIGNNHDYEF